MKAPRTLTHEFVEYVPRELKDGVVYVSIPFATVIHKCCCGCGQQVVTPLAPSQWTLSFDGRSISLHPSIGNWNFRCKSHYWIKNNQAVWAAKWDQEQIAAGRARDARAVELDFAKEKKADMPVETQTETQRRKKHHGTLSKLARFLLRK